MRAVGKDDVNGMQVIGGHTVFDRVSAAGVAGNAATHGGAFSGSRIRAELQAELGSLLI